MNTLLLALLKQISGRNNLYLHGLPPADQSRAKLLMARKLVDYQVGIYSGRDILELTPAGEAALVAATVEGTERTRT